MTATRIGETVAYHGDCIETMDTLIALGTQVDSIVTDPPYGLQFMGKEWDKLWRNKTDADQQYVEDNAGTLTSRARKLPDYAATDQRQMQTWHEEWAKRALQLLKPGGYLLAFSGSRTYHRMACAIEDAGFEVRDMLQWIYATGFPKSQNVERAVAMKTCTLPGRHFASSLPDPEKRLPDDHVCPVTLESEPWQGYGVNLKPAHEPIVMARKPLIGTVAANVMEHGTGAINIDACRVGTDVTVTRRNGNSGGEKFGRDERVGSWENPPGRFPANVLHDGSDEVLEAFAAFGERPGQIAAASTDPTTRKNQNVYGEMRRGSDAGPPRNDTGTAARFFYSAKASKKDRAGSKHPTVKPVALIEYLCKLVTRPGGTVLDPFAGSGTLGSAWPKSILIEREAEYYEDICRRLNDATSNN